MKAIGLYHRGLCLEIAAEIAGDNLLLYGPGICWAFPEDQRVRMALLTMEEKIRS